MADIVTGVKFEADTTEAQQNVGQLEGKFGSLGNEMLKANLAATAITKGVELLTERLKYGFGVAIEYEKITNRMRAALAASGNEVDKNVEALNARAAALELVTGKDELHIRNLQTMAIQYGRSGEEADKLIRASISLANVTGQDMTAAFEQIIMAQESGRASGAALRAVFGDLTGEEIKNLDVAQKMLDVYGSQLTSDLDGTTGAAMRLQSAWDDMWEAMGQSALGAGGWLTPVMNGLERIVRMMQIVAQGGAGEVLGDIIYGTEGQQSAPQRWADAAAQGADASSVSGIKGSNISMGGGKGGGKSEQQKRIEAALASMDLGIESGGQTISDAYQAQADAIERIEQRKWERIAEIERGAQEDLSRAREQDMQEQANQIGQLVMMAGSVMEDLINDLIEGQAKRGTEYVGQFVKMVGQALFAKGTADMAAALGNLALGPAGIAMVGPGMAAAGKELALGAAMMAGGSYMSKIGSGGGGGGGPALSFAGGSVGSSSSSAASEAPPPIIINVNGAVTDAGVGKQIQMALNEAKRQGLI